jgi:DNA-binding helix-hairpin-helix protein with protein kinase domain
MDWHTICERVSRLRLEVARIRKENQEYLARTYHNHTDQILHGNREVRLLQIIEELKAVTKKTFQS